MVHNNIFYQEDSSEKPGVSCKAEYTHYQAIKDDYKPQGRRMWKKLGIFD